MNPDYQTVYGVGLLDDLHNYFPAFLYEQGRFQTLPQAFSYFRHQLNTRFNLFSYGASLHRDSTPAAPTPRQPQAYTWTAPVHIPRSARDDLAADVASLNFLTSLLGARDTRITPLGSLGVLGSLGLGAGLGAQPRGRVPAGLSPFGAAVPQGLAPFGAAVPQGLAPDAWAAFNAPVLVRPSEAVLAANTELLVGSTFPLTQNCSVCQDVIVPTDECRRLKPCQHVYHRTCIDQWFLRSVVCPTCRHDIRVATPPSPRLESTPVLEPTDLSGAVPAPSSASSASPAPAPAPDTSRFDESQDSAYF
jgi:hypothetical protein